MNLVIRLLLSSLSVFITAYIVPGVEVADMLTALIVAVVMGAANMFVKPVLQLISLPLTFLTLGLFSLVINGLIVLLVSALVPGFEVNGFLPAVLFSLAISLVGSFLNSLA